MLNLSKRTIKTKLRQNKLFTHDFSLVISKQKSYCVIFCQDFPRCKKQITIFRYESDLERFS